MNLKRFARVLALLLVAPGSAFFLGAARGAEMSVVETVPVAKASREDDVNTAETSPENRAPVSPAEAQLSLDVESAPMSQVFSLIEAMTQLRARYAAPPDAVLSAHFDEEPLIPALKKMLDGSGWTAEISDGSLFLIAPTNAQWKVWTGKTAPRADWNLAPGAREYSLPAVRLNSSADAPSQLTTTLDTNPATRESSPQEKAARLAADALWQSVPLAFKARRVPGIHVVIGENTNIENDKAQSVNAKNDKAKNANRDENSEDAESANAESASGEEKSKGESANAENTDAESNNGGNADAESADIKSANSEDTSRGEKDSGEKAASTRVVWLRCDFALRVVPARLYLSIATPAAATLFINGAPVLARRSGQSRVEISQFVRRGANRVALFWKNAPSFSSSEALLRYEWQTELAP